MDYENGVEIVVLPLRVRFFQWLRRELGIDTLERELYQSRRDLKQKIVEIRLKREVVTTTRVEDTIMREEIDKFDAELYELCSEHIRPFLRRWTAHNFRLTLGYAGMGPIHAGEDAERACRRAIREVMLGINPDEPGADNRLEDIPVALTILERVRAKQREQLSLKADGDATA